MVMFQSYVKLPEGMGIQRDEQHQTAIQMHKYKLVNTTPITMVYGKYNYSIDDGVWLVVAPISLKNIEVCLDDEIPNWIEKRQCSKPPTI